MERIPDSIETSGHTAPKGCLCEECTVDSSLCPHATEAKHPHHARHLAAKNILALLAALCFVAALLVGENHLLLKAVAYGFGALAYIGELLVMTSVFTKRLPRSEMFMPLLFGAIYIIMGMSYALEHHYIG